MGLVFDYFIDFGWTLGGGEGFVIEKFINQRAGKI